VSKLKEKICIACGIFQKEIEKLKEEGKIDTPFIFIDSMYHIYPEQLKIKLEKEVKKYSEKDIILLYGDCYSNMVDMEKHKNIKRVKGINCVEIILGTEKYKKLRKEGAFFFMPEWILRWRDIFQNHLGLTEVTAKMIMQDMHTKLIYIDTGIIDVPLKELKEASEYVGLSYEIMKINLDCIMGKVLELNSNLE